MSYSLRDAAAATGRDRATIQRALKSGTISGAKDARGRWQIEPAELHRVYPPVAGAGDAPHAAQHDATPRNTGEADLLRRENAMLREQLAELREHCEGWRRVAQSLLPPPRRSTPAWLVRLKSWRPW